MLTSVDRGDIAAILTSYCTLVDLADVDGVVALFAADATVDYGPAARAEGREMIGRLFTAMLRSSTATSHLLGNVRITPMSDTTAASVSYVRAWHRLRDPQGDELVVLGRYIDRVERQVAGWVITARRLAVHDADRPVDLHRLVRG